jgi:hypothetical protein
MAGVTVDTLQNGIKKLSLQPPYKARIGTKSFSVALTNPDPPRKMNAAHLAKEGGEHSPLRYLSQAGGTL